MPRPRQCRLVQAAPKTVCFKPQGTPLRELVEVYLPVECFEALRLADHEGLTMEEAAAQMQVSRHTFGRILAQARKALATALVEGHALRIEGGEYQLASVCDACVAAQAAQVVRTIPEHAAPQEQNMQRIAVTAEGPGLDGLVDPRFGRAAGFVVVDAATMAAEYVDNGASQTLSHGAGINAAQVLAKSGAGVLLTGYVGPKAFQALQAAGIKVGQDLEGLTVRQAVQRFLDGQVPMAAGPNK
ncbi:DUF134 domain-containing protein [Megalodesulfovibrio gigas]|uniref:UPF0251 protein DGI_1969 n=2 Tax=Megalodesulfovibrio gigas TaxID=879 RepID=T2GCA1_MEGG1|nr:DUF134 domain-containing protein [Megalodesulfovibrio gigas]AGW13746.1 putative dinitrogenase iron-molybdenum cofactor [Megalodesulfovibrio gigas DSM 1382 = ATCC 19364]